MTKPPKDKNKSTFDKEALNTREENYFKKSNIQELDPQIQVVQIFVDQMQRRGHPEEIIKKLLGLWWAFFNKVEPQIKKPAIYAACLEGFYLGENKERPTQAELARNYGVTPASISRVTKKLEAFCISVLETMGEREIKESRQNATSDFNDLYKRDNERTKKENFLHETYAAVPTPSYLNGGRIDEPVIAEFFSAAANVVRATPWDLASKNRLLSENHLLRVVFGPKIVDQRWVMILGTQGEEKGLLFFRSVDDYHRYIEVSENIQKRKQLPEEFIPLLALSFDRAYKLPPLCRKEAMKYGWELEAADAYPWLLKIDNEQSELTLTEKDYHIATLCADSIARFMTGNEELLKKPNSSTITQNFSLPVRPDKQVTVTTSFL